MYDDILIKDEKKEKKNEYEFKLTDGRICIKAETKEQAHEVLGRYFDKLIGEQMDTDIQISYLKFEIPNTEIICHEPKPIVTCHAWH